MFIHTANERSMSVLKVFIGFELVLKMVHLALFEDLACSLSVNLHFHLVAQK